MPTTSPPPPPPERFVAEWALYRVAKNLRLLGYDCVCAQQLNHAQILRLAAVEGRTVLTASRRLQPMLAKLQREVEAQLQGVASDADADAEAPRLALPAKRRVLVGYSSDGESEYDEEDVDEQDIRGVIEAVHSATRGDDPESCPGAAPCSGTKAAASPVPQQVLHRVKYIMLRPGDAFENSLERVIRECRLVFDPTRVFTRCVKGNEVIREVPKASVQERVHPSVFRVYSQFFECPCCRKVFWGMESGVLVNYKALRTVEHLRQLCCSKGAVDLGAVDPCRGAYIQRHMFAYPRVVKCTIIAFLPEEDLCAFAAAFPMLCELVEIVRSGKSFKFVSEARQRKRGMPPQK